MNRYLIPCTFLVIFAILCAGCTDTVTGGAGVNATSTTPSAATGTPVTSATVVTTQPTRSLGDQYLSRSYSFSGMNNTYSEQIRIADPSWAVAYRITSLTDAPQDSRFAITVTNLDSMNSRMLTWTYLNDSFQQYPMYTPGLYEFAMTGSFVKVDLTVAKRLP